MSDKFTWWPASMAKHIIAPQIVLMRYDWPDQRIYEIGIYYPAKKHHPWTTSAGEIATPPDYFAHAEHIVQFINIPADREFTYTSTNTKES